MTVAQLSFKRNWDIFLPIYFKSLPLLTSRRSGDVESILREAFLFILDLVLMKYSLRTGLISCHYYFCCISSMTRNYLPKIPKNKNLLREPVLARFPSQYLQAQEVQISFGYASKLLDRYPNQAQALNLLKFVHH